MGNTWVFFVVQVSTDRYTCSSGDDEFSLFHLESEQPPRADKSGPTGIQGNCLKFIITGARSFLVTTPLCSAKPGHCLMTAGRCVYYTSA